MKFAKTLSLIAALTCFFPQTPYAAVLPAAVTKQAGSSLQQVGNGTYRKLGMAVYRASLWAPDGNFDKQKPYALQIRYAMSLSRKTLVNSISENINEQQVTDEKTLKKWKNELQRSLPDIKNGDVVVALYKPSGNAVVYYNGKKLMDIKDRNFSKAFFDIWLGETADKELYSQLTGA